MKVLIFSAYYDPEIAASSYLYRNLFEDMCNNDITLEMYTPMPSRGVSDEVRTQYKNKKVEYLYNNKFKINRIWLPRESKNPVLRAVRYLCMNIAFIWKAMFAKADIIFAASTPPTQGAMAVIIKKMKGIPFVYNLQDIFPDSMLHSGMTKKNSLLWKIGRIIEDFTYKHADKVVVISDDMKVNLLAKGIAEEKISVVYNWMSDSCEHVSKDSNSLFDKFGISKYKRYISYAGNIGLLQNVETIVKAADLLRNETDIEFIIFGEGVQRTKIQSMVQEHFLENIRILPMQAKDLISSVYSFGDIELVTLKKGVSKIAMPSKLWTIMAVAKPVICEIDLDSKLRDIIVENNIGICISPDDYRGMAEAILKLLNLDARELQHMGKNGKKLVENNFTRAIGTARYIDILRRIVER